MGHDIHNLFQKKAETVAVGGVEDGEIVVRIQPRGDVPAWTTEVTRLHWKGHLDAPAEPLATAILEKIARRMADLVNDAHAQGYVQAQQDIRKAMGLG